MAEAVAVAHGRPHMKIGDPYTCTACGGTFESTWDDDEAQAEYATKFPGQPEKEIVCDDCYEKITGLFRIGPGVSMKPEVDFQDIPSDQVWFRDERGSIVGKIVRIGKTDGKPRSE